MQFPKFPCPQDEAARLAPLETITASANSNQLDQGATWAPGGEGMPTSVYMNVPALKTSAGNETYVAQAQESADGSTWVNIGAPQTITVTGPVGWGIFIKLRYQQITLTLGGTSPSITFEAFLNAEVR